MSSSLYEAVSQGGRFDGVPVSLFEGGAFLRLERGPSAAPRAGAVKPDRRSPPEAARSGLDGGERGARLARLWRSRRRRGRANMMPDWASSKRGLAASPCIRSGAMARNPNPSCNDEGAAHERRDPSERAGASPWTRAVTRLSFITSAGGMARRSETRMKHGAVGDDAGLEIAPQRHHQLARHRDDGDASHPAFGVAHPRLEPSAQLAVGLPEDPPPGEFDGHRAGAAIAGLADALVALLLAAAVGRSRHPEAGADLPAIGEAAVEHLVDEDLSAGDADGFEPGELHDLRLSRPGRRLAAFSLALSLDRRDLLVGEDEPLMLTRDPGGKPGRQRPPIAGAYVLEPRQEVARQRLGVAHALSVQKRLDAVGVGGALLEQALAFAARALVVLLRRPRHMHEAASFGLAAKVGEEGAHQPLKVDAVGLGPARPPI